MSGGRNQPIKHLRNTLQLSRFFSIKDQDCGEGLTWHFKLNIADEEPSSYPRDWPSHDSGDLPSSFPQ